ncbi:MAG: hypothetical protein KA270_20125, partial [Saprospiraceae bacterium]|nr:hypothetical protein [Saprospiraceae bacterium]MBP6569493.1 hypothetical protein [Saprospiraceae bacterium]
MNFKYIFSVILFLSNFSGLLSQTALISGQIPTTFVQKAEIRILIFNQSMAETTVIIPDGTGFYKWNAPIGANYRIMASIVGGERMDDYLNGVTALDLVLILRHIMGTDILDSPSKIIAANVNLNNNVTASDMVLIKKLILRKDTNFQHNLSWLLRPTN